MTRSVLSWFLIANELTVLLTAHTHNFKCQYAILYIL